VVQLERAKIPLIVRGVGYGSFDDQIAIQIDAGRSQMQYFSPE
jgi:hypothetical protein